MLSSFMLVTCLTWWTVFTLVLIPGLFLKGNVRQIGTIWSLSQPVNTILITIVLPLSIIAALKPLLKQLKLWIFCNSLLKLSFTSWLMQINWLWTFRLATLRWIHWLLLLLITSSSQTWIWHYLRRLKWWKRISNLKHSELVFLHWEDKVQRQELMLIQ